MWCFINLYHPLWCLCRCSIWFLHIQHLNESPWLSWWQAALHFGLSLLSSPTGLGFLGLTVEFYGMWEKLYTVSTCPNCFTSFTELCFVGSATTSGKSHASAGASDEELSGVLLVTPSSSRNQPATCFYFESLEYDCGWLLDNHVISWGPVDHHSASD